MFTATRLPRLGRRIPGGHKLVVVSARSTTACDRRQVNDRCSPISGLLLPPTLGLDLSRPLAGELGRCFPPQNKSNTRGDPRRPRRRSHPGAGERTVAELDGVEHRVVPPAATLRAEAVHRLHNFGLHANVKQTHPLVRSIQNPRIVPAQTPQILTVDTEIARGRDEVAEMPSQRDRTPPRR